MSAVSALRGMVSFFTLWHLDITQEDIDSMEDGFHLVPAVGLVFGSISMLLMAVLFLFGERTDTYTGMLAAAACLLTAYIGSKFIHFDGLTDFGDGMIVSGKREDHIRALKDTLVGAGGIGVALAVTLASFSVYSAWNVPLLIILAPAAEIMVKNAMVFAAAFGLPSNGMAGRQVSKTTGKSAAKSVIVSALCAAGISAVSGWIYCCLTGEQEIIVPLTITLLSGLAVSCIAGWIMAKAANRTFGFVNGDILGATNEICRPLAVFAMGAVFLVIRWTL